MTPARQDLIQALSQIQNHPAFANQDILTITGCGMTDDEVRFHIEASMARIGRYSEKPVKAKRSRKGAH